MTVAITVEAQGMTEMQRFLDPKLWERSQRAGLLYAMARTKPMAAKLIGAQYGLKAARIKGDIGEPSVFTDYATMRFSRRTPTIRAYSGRFRTTGNRSSQAGLTTWSVLRGQQESTRHAFWRFINGRPLPLINENQGGPGKYYNGIRVLYGPSVGSIFAGKSQFGDEIRKDTLEHAQEKYLVGVEREVSRRSRGY